MKTKTIDVKCFENKRKTIPISIYTGAALLQVLPSSIKYSVNVDPGTTSLFEALVPCLRELCASASYPFPYRPVLELNNVFDATTLVKHLRPILIGISLRIHRLVNVVVFRDDAFETTQGGHPQSVQLISSLPKDSEMGPYFDLLRKITPSVFIVVVLTNETFYPVVIILKHEGKKEWRRYLTEKDMKYMSTGGITQLYSRGLSCHF